MKHTIERRKPEGIKDHLALGLTTWGVGYLPIAPGTWGSMVGIVIYLSIESLLEYLRRTGFGFMNGPSQAQVYAVLAVGLVLFAMAGIWSSGRSIDLLGNSDPSEAVVDEVMGQLVVFLFVPFGIGWHYILAGFLLFRLFDIWKPYPIDGLQELPGGLGVCADDLVAGVYAGVCLAVIYAVSLQI